MKVILTDKKIDNITVPKEIKVIGITCKELEKYEKNRDVIAFIGSRAMAARICKFEFPNLKFIQLTSAGYDGVPLEILSKKGITVANAGEIYSIPIAETVIMGILLMSKKLRNNPNNRKSKIQRNYLSITEVYKKRALIIGAGSIGTEVAKRLIGFGVCVDGYARKKGDREFYNEIITKREQLLNCIDQYDYVISTLPDTDSTRGFLNKEIFDKMKSSSVFLNVGRRATINEKDLFKVLKENKISGAVLDIFEILPNPFTNKFRRLNNVIVLPGVAAVSREVNLRLKKLIEDNINLFLKDEKLLCIVKEGEKKGYGENA